MFSGSFDLFKCQLPIAFKSSYSGRIKMDTFKVVFVIFIMTLVLSEATYRRCFATLAYLAVLTSQVDGMIGTTQQESLSTFFSAVDRDGDGEIQRHEVTRYLGGSIGGTEFDTANEINEGVDSCIEAIDSEDVGMAVDEAELEEHLRSMMSPVEVEQWVTYGLRLPQYAGAFKQNAVSGLDFPMLVNSPVLLEVELGVASPLHRTQILRSLKRHILGAGAPPSPPANLTCKALSGDRIAVSWEHPSHAGVPPCHSYVLKKHTEHSPVWETVVVDGDQEGYVDTEVESIEVYTYRLEAWGGFGKSEDVKVSNCTTLLSAKPMSRNVIEDPYSQEEGGHGLTLYSLLFPIMALCFRNMTFIRQVQRLIDPLLRRMRGLPKRVIQYCEDPPISPATQMYLNPSRDPALLPPDSMQEGESAVAAVAGTSARAGVPLRRVPHSTQNLRRSIDDYMQLKSTVGMDSSSHLTASASTVQLRKTLSSQNIQKMPLSQSFAAGLESVDRQQDADQAPQDAWKPSTRMQKFKHSPRLRTVLVEEKEGSPGTSTPASPDQHEEAIPDKTPHRSVNSFQLSPATPSASDPSVDSRQLRRGYASSSSWGSDSDYELAKHHEAAPACEPLNQWDYRGGYDKPLASRCAYPGCKSRWDRWYKFGDFRMMFRRHFCTVCQKAYCQKHTRISPHGVSGSCGLESECYCHSCFDSLAPAVQAKLELTNKLCQPLPPPHPNAPSCPPSTSAASSTSATAKWRWQSVALGVQFKNKSSKLRSAHSSSVESFDGMDVRPEVQLQDEVPTDVRRGNQKGKLGSFTSKSPF